eukprot:s4413_g1.t12
MQTSSHDSRVCCGDIWCRAEPLCRFCIGPRAGDHLGAGIPQSIGSQVRKRRSSAGGHGHRGPPLSSAGPASRPTDRNFAAENRPVAKLREHAGIRMCRVHRCISHFHNSWVPWSCGTSWQELPLARVDSLRRSEDSTPVNDVVMEKAWLQE